MKTAFKKTSEIDGTHLVGYVETTFDELVKTFGEPHHTESDDGKITAEWGLEFPDGTIATIYDWKEEETPLGKYDWHIGGRTDYAVVFVKLALLEKKEKGK
jgi:hypothetical protein